MDSFINETSFFLYEHLDHSYTNFSKVRLVLHHQASCPDLKNFGGPKYPFKHAFRSTFYPTHLKFDLEALWVTLLNVHYFYALKCIWLL